MTGVSFLILLLIGMCAGLAAGFLGIGGGAVLTPFCLLVYPSLGIPDDIMMKVIFGTNMFLVMIFSASAVAMHHGNNKIHWKTVAWMVPLAVIGSFFGAWAAAQMDSSQLKKAFAILLVVSSLMIVVRGSTRPTGSRSGAKALLPMKLLPLLGFVTGFAGSFLGIGGGVVMIPGLILLFSVPVDRVAATSSSIIIFIGVVGMSSYIYHGWNQYDLPGWSTGFVWWAAAIPLALGGVPMARVGAWLNAHTHDKMLQRIFGFVLLMIAVKMLLF